jgi:hypothetical protein
LINYQRLPSQMYGVNRQAAQIAGDLAVRSLSGVSIDR